jgi:cardiolipin synthase (CMP-forming)
LYLPNLITIARIFSVPVMIWLIVTGNLGHAFVLFVIAGLSDALDGWLARRFGWQTELGAYLDPIADKTMLTSVYASLAFHGYMPIWLGITVVSRDLLIVGAVVLAWLLDRGIEIRPLLVGKINTFLQITLAALVLAEAGFGFGWAPYIKPLLWLTGIVTALSALLYLVGWLRHMASYDIKGSMKKPAPAARGHAITDDIKG